MCMPRWVELTIMLLIVLWFIAQQVFGDILRKPIEFRIGQTDEKRRLIEVDETNFKKLREKHKIFLVMFVVKKEGGEELRRILDANERMLEICAYYSLGIDVVFGTVDLTIDRNKELARNEGVQREWTLLVYKNGAKTEYLGHRMTNYVLAYIYTINAGPIHELEWKDREKKLQPYDGFMRVIAYYPDGAVGKKYKIFEKIADSIFPHVIFYIVTDSKTAGKLKIKNEGGIILYRPFETKPIICPDIKLKSDNNEFVDFLTHELRISPHKVTPMVDMNTLWYDSRTREQVFILASIPDTEDGKRIFAQYKKLVKANSDHELFRFVWIDPQELYKIPELWKKQFDGISHLTPQIGLMNSTYQEHYNKWFNIDILTEDTEEGVTEEQRKTALQKWLDGMENIILKQRKKQADITKDEL
ncbi:unnamed protein product [Owenia fusiformis]|uniref:Calsequestrin n=1 Tax=Owenia fusiformis TaxID=6347 RepID=A0A8J1TXA8_OWEFU|nr:unnamed protein product [Owenia fusiformis]